MGERRLNKMVVACHFYKMGDAMPMEAFPPRRGVLTMAYGHRRFIEQAKDLGYSLRLHASHLPRAIVTDSQDPEIRVIFTEVLPYRPEFGSGVRQKLCLDYYSPYEETLFIDSDCLVLGDLKELWLAFPGQFFGALGYRYLKRGAHDPYMDVDFLLDHLQVTSLPKFNGGTYYFRRCEAATRFFDTARTVMSSWREIRLNSFRQDGPNDEAVYSAAMAMHGVALTYMGARGMWTPVGYSGSLKLDALSGECSFLKEGVKRTPEIIHFPGEYMYCYAYLRERRALRRKFGVTQNDIFASVSSYLASILWHSFRKSQHFSRWGRRFVRGVRAKTRSVREGRPDL